MSTDEALQILVARLAAAETALGALACLQQRPAELLRLYDNATAASHAMRAASDAGQAATLARLAQAAADLRVTLAAALPP